MKKDDEETKQLFDLIGRMLEYDPVERITLVEALQHPYFTITDDLIEERQPDSSREHRNSKSRWHRQTECCVRSQVLTVLLEIWANCIAWLFLACNWHEDGVEGVSWACYLIGVRCMFVGIQISRTMCNHHLSITKTGWCFRPDSKQFHFYSFFYTHSFQIAQIRREYYVLCMCIQHS